MLSACSDSTAPQADAGGWRFDGGATCELLAPAADAGPRDYRRPEERVCGQPGERVHIVGAPDEPDNSIDESCDVFRGDIFVDPRNEVDLSFLPPLRVIEGELQITVAWKLRTLKGLERLEHAGDVVLRYGSLEDMSALSNLRSVSGKLHIHTAGSLPDLDGLEQLRTAGAVELGGIDMIENLVGLDGLEIVHGDFEISHNRSLVNLTGLSSLEQIGGQLTIDDNPSLESLEGLESLRSVDSLTIENNPKLENIEGLSNLKCVRGDLVIGSVSLSQEQIDAVVERVEVGGEVLTYSETER